MSLKNAQGHLLCDGSNKDCHAEVKPTPTPPHPPHLRPNAQVTSSCKQKLKLPIYTLHYKSLLCVKLNK